MLLYLLKPILLCLSNKHEQVLQSLITSIGKRKRLNFDIIMSTIDAMVSTKF